MQPESDPRSTNRQRKLLRFFGVDGGLAMTVFQAGVVIDQLMGDPSKRDRWNRYKFLTRDFGRDSDELLPFAEQALSQVIVPDGWDGSVEIGAADAALVEDIVRRNGPFDQPAPVVRFSGHRFIFTGKFLFGSRAVCRKAVVDRGGDAPDIKEVSLAFDYLVVGAKGSAAWAHGDYGTKISAAVMLREKYGRPSIVAEDHWVAGLK